MASWKRPTLPEALNPGGGRKGLALEPGCHHPIFLGRENPGAWCQSQHEKLAGVAVHVAGVPMPSAPAAFLSICRRGGVVELGTQVLNLARRPKSL